MDDRNTDNAVGHSSPLAPEESTMPPVSFLQQSFELMTGREAPAEYVEALQSGHLLAGSIQLLAETIGEVTPTEEVRRAIEMAEFMRQTIPTSSEEETAEVCDRLGYMKAFLFKATGIHSVIDDAIVLGRQAVASTPMSHTKRATRLDNLGFSLSSRYRSTDNLDDLQESIKLAKESLEAASSTHPDRDMYLINLSARLIERHQKTAQSKDLDEAIDMAYQVLRAMKSDAPHRGVTLCNLTTLLFIKFEQTGFRRDLDEALRIAHLAQSCSNLTGEARALILSSLASLHAARYHITGNSQDLQDSATYSSQSAQTTQPFTSDRRTRMLANTQHLSELYRTTLTEEDMDRALISLSEAIQEHRRNPYRGQEANALYLCYTFVYGQRFLGTPNIEDWLRVIDGVIHLLSNPFFVETRAPKDFDHRQEILRRVEIHRARFHVVIEELDEVQVDIDTSLGDLSLLSPMAGRILSAMHEEYGKMIGESNPVDTIIRIIDGPVKIRFDDIDPAEFAQDTNLPRDVFSFGLKSIQISRTINVPTAAIDNLTRKKQDDEEQEINKLLDMRGASNSLDIFSVEALLKLSRFHANLYASSQQQGDLETAIQSSETCLQRLDKTDPHRASTLCALVKLYESKYAASQNPFDLQYIIRYSEMALQDSNLDQKDLLSILPKFSSAARLSFQQSSDIAELDKAANAIKLAIELSPSAMDATLPYTFAMTLKTRYQTTGEFKILDMAAQMMEQALALAKRDRDLFAAVQMSVNYALILRLRFLQTRVLDDINLALSMLQHALNAFTEPLQRLSVLNNLTLILDARYRATDDGNNIDSGIEYAEEALAILMSMEGADHLNTAHAAVLTNLANSLSIRFSLTQDPSDIDQAIEYGTQALSFATSASQGPQNSDLSGLFRARYRSTKQREDLDSAILHAAEALEYLSESHPLRPLALTQMALYWLDQEDPSNIDDAVACLNEAFNCTTASPGDRIRAAQLAAKHLVHGQKVREAASLLERAVRLMPELGAKWGSSKERQQSVVLCHGFPANAAMVALEAGLDPSLALQTLELGRGIIMGSMMDYRREVPAIKDGAAKGMEELIKAFNHARMRVDDAEPGHERRASIEEMDRRLEAIRAQPGYEDFLALPTSDDFLRLAKDGPIVVVLTSELIDHGAAILVTPTKINSIRLPLLTHDEATRRMHDLTENILDLAQGAWNQRNQDMFKLLKWLWEAAVAPVCGPNGLDVLHEGGNLARLRWVGVGVLSKAPFHIAGNYALKTPNDRITKYAISSYAPSLRALLYASDRMPKQYLHHKVDTSILLTKIADAEGVEPLENVEKEINAIQKVSDSVPMQSLVLDSPSAKEILQQLPLHNLVHFACHAVADPTDPSESHLILANGRLRVGDIVRAHAAEPDVAFLSACSTAETQDVRLADESIHIASGFLMVGFKHVVGTLWQAPDKICMKVAELFYRRLLCDEGVDWDGRWKVAEALHAATTEAQNRLPGSPLGWGPFVAFGA
ncbi:CHAT domain-containing protein [Panaeolus papilionaceus]|nr:CHAT domain-containing protein [Panaeolus papilionaceus]